MFEKLKTLADRFQEIDRQLADPQVIADIKGYQALARERASLADTVEAFRCYQDTEVQLAEAKELARVETDPEMADFLTEEVRDLEGTLADLAERLKVLLIPKDELADKDVIAEIRAGTGGDEAAIFAGDLYRMYSRFAESRRWKLEQLSGSPSEMGGFKEVIFSLKGPEVWSAMKFESGVHRVQRVPATESQGRIHTSTATVAILPEAEEVDVQIDPNDLKIDVFRSTGPGGQSVNTTDSAVRVTHKPTGLVVSCQDEKSQLQNKEKALRILRARMLDEARRAQQQAEAAKRRSQVGTGERSEKIRTYNFPQGRVTDHRIGLTLHKLNAILEGDLGELVEALAEEERVRALKEAG
ncbi:MAG: peptide chain release factor 1 [Actinobacteria bacterium]|nr:peptide chain release factor 1 [Actinomycetota bacterium]MBU1944958.1 peptide chain release factor 1 [Actinomycetota bacterium]MBU2688440.1 peptide chain release factor 1 [Actinomycetota bacterium]